MPTDQDPGLELGADLRRLRTLEGAKWTRFPGDDTLPCWVADMDLAPAPMAMDAIRRVIDRGDVGYNLAAVNRMPEVFAQWQATHHGWRPEVDRLWLFNDVLHAIAATIWEHSEPGDGIVVFTPIYPPFLAAIRESGRTIVECPLVGDGWRFDEDGLRSVIDERTRIVLWCNPHNPTGRVFDREELAALGAVAADAGLLVISDEVWGDIVHPGATHVPAATIEGLVDHCVVVSAASKSFNLAGLRSAVLFAGAENVQRSLASQPKHLRGAVNTLGAEAALACWEHGTDWLAAVKLHLLAQRDHLAARLAAEAPQVGYRIPQATYLNWLDFRAYELEDHPSTFLLEKAAIALSPGEDYGELGVGHARINVATSRAILDEILDRLVGVLPPVGPVDRIAS